MPHATDKFKLLTPLGSLFDNSTLGINIDINELLALIILLGNPVSSLPNNNISSS